MNSCKHNQEIPCPLCIEKYGFSCGINFERTRIASFVLRLSHDAFVENNLEKASLLSQLADEISSGKK
jgi:hypothetical protein